MKPDDARVGEAREWLAKASEDLASARVLSGSGHFANALFFCQQAAEKSLKAVLTYHDRPFRRTALPTRTKQLERARRSHPRRSSTLSGGDLKLSDWVSLVSGEVG